MKQSFLTNLFPKISLRIQVKRAETNFHKLASTLGQGDFYRADNDYDQWQNLRTEVLSRSCYDLDLPMPERPYRHGSNETWIHSHELDIWYLTPQGSAQVKLAIHDEKKRRFESVSKWVVLITTVIGAATGLVGAAIGLVSILPKE